MRQLSLQKGLNNRIAGAYILLEADGVCVVVPAG